MMQSKLHGGRGLHRITRTVSSQTGVSKLPSLQHSLGFQHLRNLVLSPAATQKDLRLQGYVFTTPLTSTRAPAICTFHSLTLETPEGPIHLLLQNLLKLCQSFLCPSASCLPTSVQKPNDPYVINTKHHAALCGGRGKGTNDSQEI